ncbi:hypothetical protein ABT364_13440 [Massilia sp. SR12]
MKALLNLFILPIAAAATAAAAHAGAPALRTAVVRGDAICIQQSGAAATCFQQNGRSKTLPVWSPDGQRLAYWEEGKLSIIDQHGQMLVQKVAKPVAAGEVAGGMRAAEAMQWLDGGRLVVSGSVNPTSTEYLVFDAASGQQLSALADDGYGAAFSPGGLHVATVAGRPHFADRTQRRPALLVDGRAVFESADGRVDFTGGPVWSSDGRQLSVPMADQQGRNYLLRWKTGAAHAMLQPMLTVAATQAAKGSAPGQRAGIALQPAQDSNDPLNAARSMRRALQREAGVLSGRADWWCQDCALSRLPRRTTLDDSD